MMIHLSNDDDNCNRDHAKLSEEYEEQDWQITIMSYRTDDQNTWWNVMRR